MARAGVITGLCRICSPWTLQLLREGFPERIIQGNVFITITILKSSPSGTRPVYNSSKWSKFPSWAATPHLLTTVGHVCTDSRTRDVPNLTLSQELSSPKISCSSRIPVDRLMSDKKSKKSLKHLTKNALLGIPTSIAAGPLGFRAELDLNPKSEEERFKFRDSRVT